MEQVAIFAENKKGALKDVLTPLADAGINIVGFVTNDSAEFGTIRMVVDHAEKAGEILGKKGYLYHISKVIGVEVPDTPGSLNRLLDNINQININVDYVYISYNRENGNPIMVLHTDSMMEVEESLRQRGFDVLE